MPFEPTIAAQHLASEASDPRGAPPAGWPGGAPRIDLERSPAAARVGWLAADAGLELFHFEHCAHLEPPEEWVPAARPDVAEVPTWGGGVLSEGKYGTFRHDQAIGGFHPGHRGKWTTHELCHGLVGFSWRPGATPLYLALAGRLAELLPVVLYYFLDEVHLRRCPHHAGAGPLFRTWCAACERCAGPEPDDSRALERLEDARRYLDRELVAVARSRRYGQLIHHTWASLDLASDGLAYADAHALRLDSDAFRWYAASFLVEGSGWHRSLTDLEGRVVELAEGICEGMPIQRLAPTAVHGRWRWRLQDCAWRLLQIWTDTEGEARQALETVIADLSAVAGRTGDADAEAEVGGAIEAAVADYREIHGEFVVPSPELAFAVGYDLPGGVGRSVEQVAAGVASATPTVARALGDRLAPAVAEFIPWDAAETSRAPLGRRWARWFAATHPGPLGDLVRYEGTLASMPQGRSEARVLGPNPAATTVRLAEDVEVMVFGVKVLPLLGDIRRRTVTVAVEGPLALVDGRGRRVASTPCALILCPFPGRQVQMVELSIATAEVLLALGEDGAEVLLGTGEEQALRELGVLVPTSWSEGAGIGDDEEDTHYF